MSISLFSCTGQAEKVTVIVPTGTPSLGIADALNEKELVNANIVSGSDSLVAAFTNANYDIVVAPVNLGVKFYNSNPNFEYVLYETIVWGNYFIASTESIKINSFQELDGKTLLVFGKNSTPDVVTRTLINYYNINVTLEYVDDVSTANAYLKTGKADIIVSAEPALTKFSTGASYNRYDLQQEWAKVTGSYSFPQAGIFVKKSLKENEAVLNVLEKMKESVLMATSRPNTLVSKAVAIDENLNKIGLETLQKAIPNCNLRIDENQQAAITYYCQKVIDLGIGQTVGGKLPDEGFYF
jgi:ABC-type amino acid transport substrate-binding protein